MQSESTVLGLPIGKCISVRYFDKTVIDDDGNNEEIRRPYTPVSSNDDIGYFELIIKIYENGKMSSYLDTLNIGDAIECRGPMGNIEYLKPGLFKSFNNELKCQHIGMVAGGTGITPMLQVIRAICKNNNDKTQISLIFGNVTIDDILLHEELEQLNEKHENFNVYFTLDRVKLKTVFFFVLLY